MSYDYLLFDLDGTLTDPGEGITNSVAYALRKQGIEVTDKKELYCFIGPPLSESFSRFFGFSMEESLRCVEYYREYYRDKGIFENLLYDGIPELLATLKSRGKKIILATSKPELFAKQILDHFGLTEYFDHICGASMDESRNKKAAVIEYALETVKLDDLARAVMIGDREHDINGAGLNGLDSIGVLFGYGDRPELEAAGATYIAESVEDIKKFI
ncbi:MAG: HAD family hydrolase [Clostridia bacterium]|nr:HAD family hydrolase [Clostridia bacterium]